MCSRCVSACVKKSKNVCVCMCVSRIVMSYSSTQKTVCVCRIHLSTEKMYHVKNIHICDSE